MCVEHKHTCMPELVKGTDLSSVDASLTGSNPVARND